VLGAGAGRAAAAGTLLYLTVTAGETIVVTVSGARLPV
jgi:hypothetical protein